MNEVTTTTPQETTTQDTGTPNSTPEPTNQGGKTFTQDDVDKIIAGRLAKEKERTQSAITDAVNSAVAEYERKAKLSQEEREKEDRAKREKEVSDRDRNITLRERTIEAKELLHKENIPHSLVPFIIDPDADKMASNIDTLKEAWNKAIEDGVTNKLKGTPPEDFGSGVGSGKKKIITAF